MYKASQEAGAQAGGPEANPNAGQAGQENKADGEVTDVDFEEVK